MMLAQQLKQLRTEHHISQKKLADAMQVSQQTIGSWEVGRTQPDHDTLEKLADFFQVSIDFLLGRKQCEKKLNESLDDTLEGIDFALWGEVKELTEEEKKDILEFVKFKKSQRR